ncbi:thiol peroxidase [Candidatus Dependentiae bacterium]|nr:thiol peroxidase [Candidatus Dependentiae bacterium]
MRTVTSKGKLLPVEGEELHVGDKAPDFKLRQMTPEGIKEKTLADYAGKTLILSVVPSLNTSVCASMTKRFNEEASKLPDNIKVITVSTDLPYAQARFCGETGTNAIEFASDHLDTSFGKAYGVLVPPTLFLARSVFVIDPQRKIAYAEYVPEISDLPNFDAALAAAKAAAKVTSGTPS